MQTIYSKKLIERCRRIFEKRAGRKISEGEAEVYLDRLAGVGLLAVGVFGLGPRGTQCDGTRASLPRKEAPTPLCPQTDISLLTPTPFPSPWRARLSPSGRGNGGRRNSSNS